MRVVDVRWKLDDPRYGREAYLAGHLPGAIYMDLDRDLAAPGGMRGGPKGRHPWPDAWQVARVMSASGIGHDTHVVAYDDQAGAYAARLWYLLRAYGHDVVSVLDGGIVKWLAEGRPVTTDVAEVAPREFAPDPRPGFVLHKPEFLARPAGTLVLDARSVERYRGDVEPIDPRAGHVPGAVSAPYADNLTTGPQPVFKTPEELRARFAALGAAERQPVVYCGSGVTACHNLLALDVAGLAGRLYGGSWSEWSADNHLPTALGPEPGFEPAGSRPRAERHRGPG